MPEDTDALRRQARSFLDTPEGEAVVLALGRTREALRQEKQANSAEARDAAQRAALMAQEAVDKAIGITALRRRRMLASARGEPPGTPVDERDFGNLMRPETRNSRAGRAALRHAAGRYMLDSAGALSQDFAHWLTGQARHGNDGFEGVLSHEPVSGVDPSGGAARWMREKVVADTGYTAGQKFADDNVPAPFWQQAAKAHNAGAAKLRAKGMKVKSVEALTVKDWCLREGETRKLFEAAREDGRQDRAKGRVERRRLLS